MNQTEGYVEAFRNIIFVFGFVLGARSTEPAFVIALIDGVVPFRCLVFRYLAPKVLNALVMKRLGRTHEDVVTAVLGIQAKFGKHPLQFR